jgi:hypothetical protein
VWSCLLEAAAAAAVAAPDCAAVQRAAAVMLVEGRRPGVGPGCMIHPARLQGEQHKGGGGEGGSAAAQEAGWEERCERVCLTVVLEFLFTATCVWQLALQQAVHKKLVRCCLGLGLHCVRLPTRCMFCNSIYTWKKS